MQTFLFCFFETKSRYVVQPGLKLKGILLPQLQARRSQQGAGYCVSVIKGVAITALSPLVVLALFLQTVDATEASKPQLSLPASVTRHMAWIPFPAAGPVHLLL